MIIASDTRKDPTPRKYCSASCKAHSHDKRLAPIRFQLVSAYHEALCTRPKGGIVQCSEAERAVFAVIGNEGEDRKTLKPEEQREEARRAARRLVNFGFGSQGVEEKRGVEAVQDGKVVEGSFAKGEWGIRWAGP